MTSAVAHRHHCEVSSKYRLAEPGASVPKCTPFIRFSRHLRSEIPHTPRRLPLLFPPFTTTSHPVAQLRRSCRQYHTACAPTCRHALIPWEMPDGRLRSIDQPKYKDGSTTHHPLTSSRPKAATQHLRHPVTATPRRLATHRHLIYSATDARPNPIPAETPPDAPPPPTRSPNLQIWFS
jgi:hypothetical protein